MARQTVRMPEMWAGEIPVLGSIDSGQGSAATRAAASALCPTAILSEFHDPAWLVRLGVIRPSEDHFRKRWPWRHFEVAHDIGACGIIHTEIIYAVLTSRNRRWRNWPAFASSRPTRNPRRFALTTPSTQRQFVSRCTLKAAPRFTDANYFVSSIRRAVPRSYATFNIEPSNMRRTASSITCSGTRNHSLGLTGFPKRSSIVRSS